jgi:RNA polymerase sigma factor (sigma-70 family)
VKENPLARQIRSERSYGWLQSLRSGDECAFAEFIDKYKETVFLCCRGLGLREHEAEDVASETFLAAYKGLGQYRGQSELSTWLWSIAYRQAVNYLRKNRRNWRALAEADKQIASSEQSCPSSAAQCSEEAEIVWDAVRHLPRLWAMAVILYYREQKSVDDIAKIMQANKSTIKTYLFRGRKRLKEMLAAAFTESTSVNG